MDADPKFNALFGRQAGVVLDHTALHFDGAADRVDHAAELDDQAIAGTFDHTTMLESGGRINEIAAKAPRRARIRSSSAPASGYIRQRPRPGSPRVFEFRPSRAWQEEDWRKNLQRHGEPLNFCNHAIIVACSAMR